MKIRALVCTLVLFCGNVYAVDVIPKPVKVAEMAGSFSVTPSTRIIYSTPQVRPLAEYLCEYLPVELIQAPSFIPREKGNIVLAIDPAVDLPAEGYRLSVYEDKVNITGKDYGGLFNGIQTFLQLLPPQVYTKNTKGQTLALDNVIIRDWPQMAYRGMLLDVARTFFSKEDVMRFIDNMSHYKINKLHFHLMDDEGWRLEIKSHPELAETGGFRGGDSPIKPVFGKWDEKYGGYYTQEEVREIIDYAAKRNVEIIPEFDLPGHSRAIALLHPEILCDYKPDLTASAGYDRRNVWCVSREDNYVLLDEIIKEIAMLFPSEYIHIGGDEVQMGQWSKCPHCSALMRQKGIDGAGLQEIFMTRMAEIVSRNGKKAAVWNEAINGGTLPKDIRVHCWENVDACKKSTAEGYSSIIMPGKYFYFDMKQSENETGHNWAGIFDTEDCYSFDFEKEGFSQQQMRYVAGVEGAFWSEVYEFDSGHDFLDYQTYPRICALSEIGWTPQSQRSWKHFASRLNDNYAKLEAMGIKYRTEPEPAAKPKYIYPKAELTSSMEESARNPFVRAAEYKSQGRTKRTCIEGDWFLFTFEEPQTCRSIDVVTGYPHLPRYIFLSGYVEVSSDGQTFTRKAELKDGKARVDIDSPVKAVRIVASCHGNGEDNVVIQPLKIAL